MARRQNFRSAFTASQTGVSALEFAIIAPVAILLFFGLIAYGLVFALHLELQHLVAETGRATIPGLEPTERRQLAETEFHGRSGRYPFLDAAAARLEVEDDGRATIVRVLYDPSDSPAYLMSGLIPLPDVPFIYEQTITNGGR